MKPLALILCCFFVVDIAVASCTATPVTVCTTILYKRGKNIQCSTTYLWECSNSTGGGSSGGTGGGSSSPGSGGAGSGGGSSPSTPPNAANVADCFKAITSYTKVLDEFGATEGRNHPHTGIDLEAPNGTPLYSPVNGEVIAYQDGVPVDVNSRTTEGRVRFGNMITIRVDDAYENGELRPGAAVQVILDHLHPDVLVRNGQAVKIGELIGYTDNTGDTTIQPHLHLTVKANTSDGPKAVDPRNVIKKENCN